MPKAFAELRERLLRSGVAPRHVRRYLAELTDHLADLKAAEEHAGLNAAQAEAAARTRLGTTSELARAMESRSELRAWSARAPWLVFSLGPVLAVAAAYLFGCTLLWSGWHLFVPYSITPFVRVSGVSIVWFGIGRLIYFTAPVFVGWGVAMIAARQRLRVLWPAIGLALLALVGTTSQVHVAHWGPGAQGNRVSMGFSLAEFARVAGNAQPLPFRLLSPGVMHVLLLFTLAALPYVAWRAWREAVVH